MTETIHRELPVARGVFDPDPLLGALRETEPVSRVAFPDGHLGWLITSYELNREVLADNRFSNRAELQRMPIRIGGEVVGQQPAAKPGMFINMDPPDHTKYRKQLTGQFTVRRMNLLMPRIDEIVADHLRGLRAHGSPVDLVKHFALPVPSLVICELLGVPYEERHGFQESTRRMVNLESSFEDIMAAFTEVEEYLAGLVARKHDDPGDDMLTGLIQGGQLTDEEVANIGVLLLVAGHETTANMLALGTLTLLRHPEQLAALKADPSLVDNAVEELMRYLTIIQFGTQRVALEDVELHGHTIRAGDAVIVSVPAANRDPRRFERPDEFDIRRPASGHLSFGHGVHQCLGQQLARIEMRAGFAALFREFPDLELAVAPEEVPMKTGMSIYGVHSLPVKFS
ncbi:cytochrome P450 [Saccharothrix violaceirubra]|uniref:Cytochrome P450 n=1 Tax=Saccharothrix violaceirubra TaxID=413306 RepID=A0A7W7WY42_9PSEU|nr:cytochrome P450 [Saccharothrix violaceirubra]MBB4967817.1 cytochrome P450 [Saccharothrix violaceirubra]